MGVEPFLQAVARYEGRPVLSLRIRDERALENAQPSNRFRRMPMSPSPYASIRRQCVSSRCIWIAVLSWIAIALIVPCANAQYRASIQGVVTDQTGAVVPGANLVLTNTATG